MIDTDKPDKPLCGANASDGCVYFYAEAEKHNVASPMQVSSSSDTSGDAYVSSAVEFSGQVDVLVQVPKSGDYIVWARVLGATVSTDSFFVAANGGSEDIYDVAEGTWSAQWQWTRVNGRNEGANPRVFALDGGLNTLSFRGREAGAGLDVILVTNDVDFVPQGLPCSKGLIVNGECVADCPSSAAFCEGDIDSTDGEVVDDVDVVNDDDKKASACPQDYIVVSPDAAHPDEFTVVVKDKDGNPVRCAQVVFDLEAAGCATGEVSLLWILLLGMGWWSRSNRWVRRTTDPLSFRC
ncbi:MAG: hypothetical protein R3C68_13290 [Myxococcota bacterium]